MITKRIIPCLDVKNGRVVKGVNFQGLSDVSSPVELGKYYSDNGADELVFYDITASAEGRRLFTDILTKVAETIFIPLTVGGGINTLDDFDRVLKCGADKVSVNSGAIRNPQLIFEAAKRYGDQCVVLSADVKRVDGVFRVFAKGGRENTGMEAIEWIRKGVSLGAVTLSLGGLLMFFLGTLVFGFVLIPRLLKSIAKFGDDETLILTVLGCCFFVSYIAYVFNFSLALGAFLVGLVGSVSGVRSRLVALTDPLKAMYAAVFFVSIGLLVDPAALAARKGDGQRRARSLLRTLPDSSP